MDFAQNILFFFSALGVFNGLVLAVYFLFFAKPHQIRNQLFGLLILMLSLRIGKSVWYHFDPGLSKHILQIGLSACAFIGPFLFLYVRSIQSHQQTLQKRDIYHIAIVWVLIFSVGTMFPYAHSPHHWNTWIVKCIYAVWLAYTLATGYEIQDSLRLWLSNTSRLSTEHKWLLTVFGMNAVICLVFNSILYVGFPSYIFGPITFSLVFYGLMAFLMLNPKSHKLIDGAKRSYAYKKIETQKASEIEANLRALMVDHALYKDPGLTLGQLAEKAQISPHLLSQYLNEEIHKGYSDFVNGFRIQAASQLLQSRPELTVEGIGKEVGFRSKSSFYTAFKKYHGITPSQFCKQGQA